MSAIFHPRIDFNVTIQCNHLIKSPYCVHPNTGKNDIILGNICVYLDLVAENYADFDPTTCLNIRDINKNIFKLELEKNLKLSKLT